MNKRCITNMSEFIHWITIIVNWQLRVTVDSIRNSCDVSTGQLVKISILTLQVVLLPGSPPIQVCIPHKVVSFDLLTVQVYKSMYCTKWWVNRKKFDLLAEQVYKKYALHTLQSGELTEDFDLLAVQVYKKYALHTSQSGESRRI